MVDPADRALIDRYFVGDCTPEEAERACEVLAAHLGELAVEFTVPYLDADPAAPPRSAHESLRALRVRLAGPANRTRGLHLVQAAAPRRRSAAGWTVAATFVVAVGATFVWRGVHLTDRHRAAAPEQFKTFGTVRGQQATLELSDGTQVMLAPESHLRVPIDYGISTRAVQLDGEAYFDVHHDLRHPFSVRAGAAVTEDVGTTFDVRAYSGEASVRVVVVEGIVEFSRAVRSGDTTRTSRVRLSGGTVASIDATGVPRVGEHVVPDTYTSWREGRLVFDRMPLRDALVELARWYDIDLQVADSALANRPLTVSIRSAPVVEVLNAVAAAMDARWERHDQTITFVSAGVGR